MTADVPAAVLRSVRSVVDAIPTPRTAPESEHHCACPDCREKELRQRREANRG